MKPRLFKEIQSLQEVNHSQTASHIHVEALMFISIDDSLQMTIWIQTQASPVILMSTQT
jgi:hypothetical protein